MDLLRLYYTYKSEPGSVFACFYCVFFAIVVLLGAVVVVVVVRS